MCVKVNENRLEYIFLGHINCEHYNAQVTKFLMVKYDKIFLESFLNPARYVQNM